MANNASFLSAISSFNKGSMQKTTTRVRTREGKVYEERLENDNFTAEYKGQDTQPTYMSDSEKGFTALIPGVFDKEKQRWVNKIYEEGDQTAINHTTETLSFVTFNVWFSELFWKERAEAMLVILEKLNPDILSLLVRATAWLFVVVLFDLQHTLFVCKKLHSRSWMY